MDFLKEVIEVGLGALAMTKEKAEALAKDIIKKNNLQKAEGEKLIKELKLKGAKQEKEIAKVISKLMKEAQSQFTVATKADIDSMEKKIKKCKSCKK